MTHSVWFPAALKAAFAQHHAGVVAESGRDYRGAGLAYAQGLDLFAQALASPSLQLDVEKRFGQLKLLELNVVGLTREFLEHFPAWLVGFHVERAVRALAARQPAGARLHCGCLGAAKKLFALGRGLSHEGCRSQIMAALVNDSLLHESPSTRARVLETLDAVLQADPDNHLARGMARNGYAAQLWNLMAPSRTAEPPAGAEPPTAADASPGREPPNHARAAKLLRHPKPGRTQKQLLTKSARKLRRYLRKREATASASELCVDHLVMATYLGGRGSSAAAIRMARRARRLDPQSEDARALVKTLRRRRR